MVRRCAAAILCLAPLALGAGCGLGHRVEMLRSSHKPVGPGTFVVRADLPDGKMQVAMGRPAVLYDLALSYCQDHFRPLSHFEADASGAGLPGASLLEAAAIPLRGDPPPGGGKEPNLMTLLLRPGIPLELRLSAGRGEMDLDLTALGITRLAVHGGEGPTRLRFSAGNPREMEQLRFVAGGGSVRLEGLGWGRVASLEFHGGAGGASLDWRGPGPPEAAAFLDPGTGSLTLSFPGDLGVTLSAKGLPAATSFPGFRPLGGGWVSDNFEETLRRLTLVLDPAAGNGVKVIWIR